MANDDKDGLPLLHRYWAAITLAFGVMLVVLDGTIANIALPTIARDIHTSAGNSIWVVNAYQLAMVATLLPFASLGEILGYRRVYLWGLFLFTISSLACALSTSFPELLIARVVQGVGAACTMSVNGALLRFIYPKRLFGRGIGYNAMVVSISSAIGPTVSAAILSVAHWQFLFAVNLPIGAAALVIGARALPKTNATGTSFDLSSALLNALTFGLLITGIDALGRHGQTVLALSELVAAFFFGFLLVRRQLAVSAPLLPVDLLKLRPIALAVGTSICSYAAQTLAFVALPFYLQDELGRTVVETGLLMTPWPIANAIVAPLSGRLSDRFSAGVLGAFGLAVLAVGLGLTALLPQDADAFSIGWRMFVCGVGFGLFQTPNNRSMIVSAPNERSGGASGLVSTARLVGQTSGAALVALAFGFAPQRGTLVALSMGAAFSMAGAIVSSLRLSRGVRSR